MKIAVVGCGAVGSFYGAKLARAGGELHFLVRSDYQTVRRKGVFIRSKQGDFRVHFGLGKAKQVDRVEIRWPSGVEQVLTNVRTNQVLQVTEPAK